MMARISILCSSHRLLCSCLTLASAFGCASEDEVDDPNQADGIVTNTTDPSATASAPPSDANPTSSPTSTPTATPTSSPTGNPTSVTPTTSSTPTAAPTATTPPPGPLPTEGAGGSNPGGALPGETGGTGDSGGTSGDGGAGVEVGAGGQPGDVPPGPSGSTEYNPDFVEFYGADCDVGNPTNINSAKLPDLFESFDGTRLSKKSEWRCRRAELQKAVETYIHGAKPGRPDSVTGSVSASSISVRVEHGGKSISFSASVSIPSGATRPAPAIIGLGGSSLRGSVLSGEGVATINYNHNQIANEGSRNGLFTDIYGSTGASAQIGWAWGISRILDVLVDERDAGRNDLIDPTAIGVTGCSRNGKGAFTVGAFDERIALGIPQESGTGGVSALRILGENIRGPNGQPSQSISSAWSEAQGWFGTVFGDYRNNVNVMPADTHSMVAMYAPRGLLVLDNSRIGELGSIAQHAATEAGAEVFRALGVEKNVAYHGGNASDPHNHCAFYDSQAEPLRRAIQAHLTRTAEPDGRMEPQPVATADMDERIDWEAPVLE